MRSGKKIRKKTIRNFTLVEVLVSMAVFSIMLLMLLQFFSGTQKLWASSERKSNLYANARTAMNFMASTLQVMHYIEGESPFKITKTANGDFHQDELLFVSKFRISSQDGTETLYYLNFHMKPPADNKGEMEQMLGKLYLDFAGPEKGALYNYSFYSWAGTTYNPADYTHLIEKKIDPLLTKDQEIISGVTSLEIVPLVPDYNTTTPLKVDNTPTRVPVAVEIKLSMLSPDNYLQWYEINGKSATTENAAGKKFRLENQQTFSRIVHLGDHRWK